MRKSFWLMLAMLVAQLCLTLCAPWTIDCQASLCIEFPRQEYWSGLQFAPPEDLPDPGIKLTPLVSPALAHRLFTAAPPGTPPHFWNQSIWIILSKECFDREQLENQKCPNMLVILIVTSRFAYISSLIYSRTAYSVPATLYNTMVVMYLSGSKHFYDIPYTSK